MILTARKTIASDPYDLAPRLRVEDVAEIKAASGKTPLEALYASWQDSSPCYTVVTDDDDQTVVAMFGVVPADDTGKVGVVWLLSSPLLHKYSKEFIRQSPDWISKLHKKYPCLWNFVDARNTTHVKWLKYMGANFISERIHGAEQILFKEFIIV